MALDTVLSEYADFCPVCTEMAVLRWSDSDLDERICDGCAECLVEAEHVFGLCHLLGFRFAPRLSDLAERRLYVAEGHADHGGLDSLIGGVINLSKIEENWDETLRVTASIRAGTVAFSASAPASCLSPAERSGQGAARDRMSRTDPVHPRLDFRSGAQAPFQCWAQ